ncbi:hypothetical protein CCP3SC1_660002 [Gammaproteobacteria bacterium]
MKQNKLTGTPLNQAVVTCKGNELALRGANSLPFRVIDA